MRNGNKPLVLSCNVGQDESGGGRMGALYSVVNMELPSLGDTLRRRHGSTKLTVSGPTYAFHLFPTTKSGVRPSVMLETASCNLIGNSRGYAFGASKTVTSTEQSFNYLGGFSSAQPVRTRYSLCSPQTGVWGASPPAAAVSSDGYVLIAAENSSGVIEVSIEDTSGQRVSYSTFTGTKVIAWALTTTIYIAIQQSRNIVCYKMEPSSSDSWTASVSFSNAVVNASANWDLTTDWATKWWLVAQYDNTHLQVLYYINETYQDYTSLVVTTGSYAGVSVSWLEDIPSVDTNTVWVGWYDDPSTTRDVKYTVLNEDLSDATGGAGPYTISSGAVLGPPMFGPVDYSGHDDWTAYMTAAAFGVFRYSSNSVRGCKCFIASATAGPSQTVALHPGLVPMAKPDSMNRVWCITDNGSGEEVFYRWVLAKFFVRNYDIGADSVIHAKAISIEAATQVFPVAKSYFDPGLYSNFNWFINAGGETAGDGDRVFPVVAILASSEEDDPSHVTARILALQYSVSEERWRHTAVPFRDTAVISGCPTEVGVQSLGKPVEASLSTLHSEPGFGSSEISWAFDPVIMDDAVIYGAPGAIETGTYYYRIVFQWVDGRGRRHLSAPSAPYGVTTTEDLGNVTLDLTSACATLRVPTWTNLASLNPSILIFRTTNAGTIYHLVDTIAGVDHSDGLLQYADTAADATIEDNEILYTDGGVLPNRLAPSCRFVAKSADRLWFGGCFDSYTVYCTKLLVPPEPPNYAQHEAFEVTFPEEVTGLCCMDDQVIVFSERSTFIVTGQGPDDKGYGTFDPPRKIADVGCIDSDSVLVTEAGVFFRSKCGIKLLPKGLGSIQDIGQPVRESLSGLTVIAAASGAGAGGLRRAVFEEIDGLHQAHFLLADTTLTGYYSTKSLVYDILNNAWFVFDYSGENKRFRNMGAWSLGFAWSGTSDTATEEIVQYQMGGEYQDESGTYLEGTVETAWQFPFGQGGWGRVDRVLLALTGYNYSLTCTISIDGTTQAFTVSVPSASPATSPYIYRECVLNQCQGTAVKVTLANTSGTPSTDSRLFGVGSILFETEDQDGVRLLTPAEKRA